MAGHQENVADMRTARLKKLGVYVRTGVDLAQPLPPLEYFVPELELVRGPGAPHVVGGYGYSGKTMALQSLALSLVSGFPVWGTYRVEGQYKVLHVDYEQGERLTQRRYQRLAKAMGIELPAVATNIGVASYPRLRLAAAARDAWAFMTEGYDLVIIDSLRAANGGDENSSQFRDGLDMLGHISALTGCRAVVVHHARKPTEGAQGGAKASLRGSGAIFDALDCCYIFSGDKGEPTRCCHEKARSSGELIDDWALIIRDVERDGDPKAGLEVAMRGVELIEEKKEAAAEERKRLSVAGHIAAVRRELAKRPGITATELRDLSGLSGTNFRRAILELGSAVQKDEHNEGRRRWTTYRLVR